jgi:hypothetical protein
VDDEDFVIEDPTELELVEEPAVAEDDGELTLAEIEEVTPLPPPKFASREEPRIIFEPAPKLVLKTPPAPPATPAPPRPVVQIRPAVAEVGKPASAVPAPHFKADGDRRFTWDEPRILWEES